MAGVRKRLSYRDAGVDIDAGDEVVERIRRWVMSTYTAQVLPESHGAFGGFYRLFGGNVRAAEMQDPVLVATTDGVGTKLKIAFLMNRFDTIGIDLVAMSVNDLIVGGAIPLFFLDYIATSAIAPAQLEEVVRGIAAGCRQAGCALLGGETAEMPGFYKKGELDLAGFAVGVVDRKRIIDGRRVQVGDAVVGVHSSGLHSNGYSLARKVLVDGTPKRALKARVAELGRSLGEELLEPTRIYAHAMQSLGARYRGRSPIHGVAHITGGGLVGNVPRALPDGCAARIERRAWEVPAVFRMIQREGNVAPDEMDRVFNNGIGVVLIVAARFAKAICADLAAAGEKAGVIGEVVRGPRRVTLE